MKFLKIQKIEIDKKRCYDLTVENNHNFFCNSVLIHNCDYRGELGVLLYNTSKEFVGIDEGDRIAQLVFAPVVQVDFEEVEELDETKRSIGGWGSTG